MSDKKIGMDYSIGHTRMKYLDLANLSFAQGNYSQCKGYIDGFVNTLDDDSVGGKHITEEFNKIFTNRDLLANNLEQEVKKLGYLERRDYEEAAKSEINIDNLHDLKAVCWRISLKDGLFDE